MMAMTKALGQRGRAIDRLRNVFEPHRLVVALAGTLGVLLLTHIPQAMMPKPFSGKLLDKGEHAVAYGVIAFLFLRSFRRAPGAGAPVLLLLVGMALAALDEVTQPLVNRHASRLDFAADCIGIVVACVVFLALQRFRRQRERRCASVLSS
jgi:VanZ family protein